MNKISTKDFDKEIIYETDDEDKDINNIATEISISPSISPDIISQESRKRMKMNDITEIEDLFDFDPEFKKFDCVKYLDNTFNKINLRSLHKEDELAEMLKKNKEEENKSCIYNDKLQIFENEYIENLKKQKDDIGKFDENQKQSINHKEVQMQQTKKLFDLFITQNTNEEQSKIDLLLICLLCNPFKKYNFNFLNLMIESIEKLIIKKEWSDSIWRYNIKRQFNVISLLLFFYPSGVVDVLSESDWFKFETTGVNIFMINRQILTNQKVNEVPCYSIFEIICAMSPEQFHDKFYFLERLILENQSLPEIANLYPIKASLGFRMAELRFPKFEEIREKFMQNAKGKTKFINQYNKLLQFV